MKNPAVSLTRYMSSFARAHRWLVSVALGIFTVSVGAVALAAIVSGSSTTGSSNHVTYTQLTVPVPTESTGDVMLASIAIKGGTADVVTAPSGWTQIVRTDNDTNATLISYYKVANGSSEPASYTWTIQDQTRAEGGITDYNGVDTSSPIDVFSGNIGRGRVATTSAITTISPNDQIVALFATDVGTTSVNGYFLAPTAISMTQKYNAANDALGPSIAAFDASQATPGNTGSIDSATGDNKVRDWSAQEIALKPAISPIQLDATSSNFSTNPGIGITTAHTVSGSNRVLFVSVTTSNVGGGGGDQVSGVTYDGTPMTLAGKVATYTGSPDGLETYLYYLFAPDIGTHDIVVSYPTYSGNVYVASASYDGVSQTALDAVATSSPDLIQSSISGTVTTLADNDWVVMGSYSGNGNTSAGTGTTIRATSPTQDRQVISDNGGPKHPAGSVTLTINNDSDRVGSITAAIAPAP